MKYLIALLLLTSAHAFAKTPNQADIIHPDIHNKVGNNGNSGGRANANPNDANDNGGQIHGIGNNPGQSGSKPNDDGVVGQANELDTIHGGISDVNKNAD